MKKCPKCGYERQPQDDDFYSSSECPKCKVIYEKYESYLYKKQVEEEAKKEQEAKKSELPQNNTQSRSEEKSNLVKCKICGKEISKNAQSCPHCGEPLPLLNKDKKEIETEKIKKGCLGCLAVIAILIFFVIIIGLITSDNNNHKKTVKKWYEGGNLHSASVLDWNNATYENKLATAADMAISLPRIANKVKDSGNIDTVKPYAQELVLCINEACAGQGYGSTKIAEVAASCMILMKWY